MKIVVTGDSQVGKTSLIQAFKDLSQIEHDLTSEGYKMTKIKT